MSETDQFSQYAKEKHIYGTKLTEQSNYWNDRAEECRTLVELLRAPRAKARMLQVADTYERLARQATRGRQAKIIIADYIAIGVLFILALWCVRNGCFAR